MCTRTTIGMLAVSALAVSACGGSSQGATNPRPPAPVNLTVYIDNSRVSVSPSSVGDGPVAFIITNQASQAESLAVLPAGAAAGRPLASTGPINPQATAQITVNFSSPGRYSLSTGGGDASAGSSIQAATLTVGKGAGNSNNQLLQP
ncbi:MAG: hypothetical protein JO027_01025 [Solirubrobacterales bacterium]|nr:hypothetical protein [Solirubrobacterales bacterium]